MPASRDAADEPPESAAAVSHLVLVPRTVGPLQDLGGTKRGDDDDIEVAIDELFGDITDEEPGRFDVALLIAGAGLVLWWALSAMTGPGLVLGIISVILGLALPARNAIRKANGRLASARLRRALDQGYPLDVGNPAVAGLVAAYERLRQAAARTRAPHTVEAVASGHRAVVEVATLLGTARPTAAADTQYVRDRTKAIKRLTTSIRAAAEGADASPRREPGVNGIGPRRSTGAVAVAREQLDASTGLGTIDEIDALAERIDGDSGRQWHG